MERNSPPAVGLEASLPNHLRLQTVALERLVFADRTLRKHPASQIRKIARSLETFGWVTPIVIDESGLVIAGRARLEAARALGMTQAPAVSVHHLSAAEKRAYIIADNRLAEDASWDPDALRLELAELLELDIEIDVTGFEAGEIDVLLDAGDLDGADPADATPAPREIAVSRPGDLWEIGPHRLLCSDALDPTSYELVLDGAVPSAVFTDPPYNVPISGHVCGLGRVQHREFAMASGEMTRAEFGGFLRKVCDRTIECLPAGGIAFVCMDWRSAADLIIQGEAAGFELLNLCVWAKTNGGMGGLYRSQHELVPVFKKPGAAHANNVQLGKHGRNRTNVWSYPGINAFGATRDQDLASHPTVKPVQLVADAILDVTARGDIVLDPFGGSGTTLVAAHRSGRIGHAIELDPTYVDVIVRRMQTLFGMTAINAATGQSFDALEECAATSAAAPASTDQRDVPEAVDV
jgi:DNA modification methylase